MAKLKPRARIIRTIGDQLISGAEAAIIELVKNAYDADSPGVDIKIMPPFPTEKDALIIISDQGHGMTYNDIINRWFEPATDEKKKRRYSPAGRLMLGEKGIGRFAVSRLGSKTNMTAVGLNKNQYEQTSVNIDWNIFSADQYLEDIDIPIQRKKLSSDKENKTGVNIEIRELRDKWTKRRLTNLIRELRRVITPDDTHQFDIRLDLAGFTEETVGFNGLEELKKININLTSDKRYKDDNLGSGLIKVI